METLESSCHWLNHRGNILTAAIVVVIVMVRADIEDAVGRGGGGGQTIFILHGVELLTVTSAVVMLR